MEEPAEESLPARSAAQQRTSTLCSRAASAAATQEDDAEDADAGFSLSLSGCC